MKIVVLVKQVPDTWGERRLDLSTGWLDRAGSDAIIDEIDERALEVALRSHDASDAEVVALTVGPASANDTLRKALAMGADSAVHVQNDRLAGADILQTARAIASALTAIGFDLVIAGNESTDGRGGVVPAMVAELLGVPHLTHLDALTIGPESISGERNNGQSVLTVTSGFPAVASVTERAADPRFATFRGIMKAKKKRVDAPTAAEVGLAEADSPAAHAATKVIQVSVREPKQPGITIVDDGTAGEQLATFLRERKLIERA
jgi:electron transfer flavoprotein beta subunit